MRYLKFSTTYFPIRLIIIKLKINGKLPMATVNGNTLNLDFSFWILVFHKNKTTNDTFKATKTFDFQEINIQNQQISHNNDVFYP